jgi:uncharacterized glyoxalase superfamily protein PhnB
MSVTFNRTVPILRIFSVEKAHEFYLGFLGFKVDWEHRFHDGAPLYTQVSRGSLHLHLSEHSGDGTPGSAVYVDMRGIDEFHRDIMSKGYRYNRPAIQEQEWGVRELTVIDPFHNTIRFCEPIPGK